MLDFNLSQTKMAGTKLSTRNDQRQFCPTGDNFVLPKKIVSYRRKLCLFECSTSVFGVPFLFAFNTRQLVSRLLYTNKHTLYTELAVLSSYTAPDTSRDFFDGWLVDDE